MAFPSHEAILQTYILGRTLCKPRISRISGRFRDEYWYHDFLAILVIKSLDASLLQDEVTLSDKLKKLLDCKQSLPAFELVGRLWDYIDEENLFIVAENKISPNTEMQKVFGVGPYQVPLQMPWRLPILIILRLKLTLYKEKTVTLHLHVGEQHISAAEETRECRISKFS